MDRIIQAGLFLVGLGSSMLNSKVPQPQRLEKRSAAPDRVGSGTLPRDLVTGEYSSETLRSVSG